MSGFRFPPDTGSSDANAAKHELSGADATTVVGVASKSTITWVGTAFTITAVDGALINAMTGLHEMDFWDLLLPTDNGTVRAEMTITGTTGSAGIDGLAPFGVIDSSAIPTSLSDFSTKAACFCSVNWGNGTDAANIISSAGERNNDNPGNSSSLGVLTTIRLTLQILGGKIVDSEVAYTDGTTPDSISGVVPTGTIANNLMFFLGAGQRDGGGGGGTLTGTLTVRVWSD